MILGRGTATNDEEIIAEFYQLLATANEINNLQMLREIHATPQRLRKAIGKPFLEWGDEDFYQISHGYSLNYVRFCCKFLAFLCFRGYCQISLPVMAVLPTNFCRQFRSLIAPHRERMRLAQVQMGYVSKSVNQHSGGLSGTTFEIYIRLLIHAHKPPHEFTREDFDCFAKEYDGWYRTSGQSKKGDGDHRLFRLEQILIFLGDIPEKPTVPRHETLLLPFPPSFIRAAMEQYLRWSAAKYSPKTLHQHCSSAIYLMRWLTEHYPNAARLDQIGRPIALHYASYLRQLSDEKRISKSYLNQLYSFGVHLFDFALDEGLETVPERNPFAKRDIPKKPDMVPRYLPDQDLRSILNYCEKEGTLVEQTVVIVLLHTGIRASELAALKASDMVQIGGAWKLHIHEGKGLKDRVIPLTTKCMEILHTWMETGWQHLNEYLFASLTSSRTRKNEAPAGSLVQAVIRRIAQKLNMEGITPHRFRHTFAVALLNYGVRESALQKLMGHATLSMTLEYARILDETVERSFNEAVMQMEEGPISWVPSFFVQEDYTLFAEGDSVSWIQLPVGFCRRNPKLHCESDVKCFLCERFCATPKDLPRLQQMYERFTKLGLKLKADVVSAQIQQLRALPEPGAPVLIPTNAISVAPKRAGKH